MPIEKTDVYQRSCQLSDSLYTLVSSWPSLAQRTLGEQLVRSIDSIAANLVEGDGRQSTSDTSRFFIYSRSSAREARHWVQRASQRGLLEESATNSYVKELTEIALMINALVKRRSEVREVKETRYNSGSYEDPFSDPLPDLVPSFSSNLVP